MVLLERRDIRRILRCVHRIDVEESLLIATVGQALCIVASPNQHRHIDPSLTPEFKLFT